MVDQVLLFFEACNLTFIASHHIGERIACEKVCGSVCEEMAKTNLRKGRDNL